MQPKHDMGWDGLSWFGLVYRSGPRTLTTVRSLFNFKIYFARPVVEGARYTLMNRIIPSVWVGRFVLKV